MQPQKSVNQQPAKQPNLVHNRHYTRGTFCASLLGFLLIAAGVILFYNRQAVIDQITVWRFVPSESLVSLVDTVGLNERGKFYLYASRAEVSDRTEFNDACGKLQNERTVVIGCYTGPDKRIYIYNVTDSQLEGVKETTTAHEMLHAAYDRLSQNEKERIDALLIAQKATITDERILKLIAEYQKTEPDEVINELHSIFGTEIRDLSPELEAYYAKYFSDRSKVVTLKEKYEQVFTDLATTQAQLVDELNTLASDVNARQKSYQSVLATLNTDIATFNEWAVSGAAPKSEYNTKRAALQDRIAVLDAERDAINSEIDSYNTKKAELDKLNMKAATLNQSIDSKLSASLPSL